MVTAAADRAATRQGVETTRRIDTRGADAGALNAPISSWWARALFDDQARRP